MTFCPVFSTQNGLVSKLAPTNADPQRGLREKK